MAEIKMYTLRGCPYCERARRLLQRKSIGFQEIDATEDTEMRAWLLQTTGRRTLPQVFINGRSVGGSDDLSHLESQGELDRLLAE